MSDYSQGPGWWLASDGKWYPPSQKPGARVGPPNPVPSAQPHTKPGFWKKPVPLWAVILIGLGAWIIGGSFARATLEDTQESSRDTVAQQEPNRSNNNETQASSGEVNETTTTSVATTTTKATTTTVTKAGTRENPHGLGTPLSTKDGVEVVVNSVDFEAEHAITAENRFNDPAEPGFRYILVNLSITNNSSKPIQPWLEVNVEAIGSQNQVHSDCRAVVPDDIFHAPELYPGGTASGNECVLVPEEEVADGSLVIMISSMFGDPVFVSPM